MGLDMYLTGEKFYFTAWQNSDNYPKEDGYQLKNKTIRLGYWRKNPDLHGYIVKTFADGKDECQKIELSKENIFNIIEAIGYKKLPHTKGFFFGSSSDWSGCKETEETIKVFMDAITWVSVEEKGVSRSVIYQASW